MRNLKMKIFITGGTSGIGKALSEIYLQNGDTVGICGGTKDFFQKSFPKPPNGLSFFELDIRDREKVKMTLNEFTDDGQLDLVICCAGIGNGGQNDLIPDFDLANRIIDINLKGVINTFEAALKIMVPQKGGHLVALGSIAGFFGLSEAAAYGASKAALINFCEALAIALKHLGIHVSLIAPGFVDTPLTKASGRKMLFLMKPECAARKIAWAIHKKKELFVFPISMKILAFFLQHMPRFIYRNLYRFAMKER